MASGNIQKCLFLFLLTLLNSVSSLTQVHNIEFDHYTTNDGLSNGYINSIIQDKAGYMWFATGNGLNRFDGFTFRSYYSNPKDTTTLSGTSVTAMAEDAFENLWVMTNSNMCVYDRKKDNFKRIRLFVKKEIFQNSVTACFVDKKGFMWIGSYTGVLRFRLTKDLLKSSNNVYAERYEIEGSHNFVTDFVEDKNGVVWTVDSRNRLFFFDAGQKRFSSIEINHPESARLNNENKGIYQDKDGDFFITIEHVGLLWWNRKENKFKLFKPVEKSIFNGVGSGPVGDILFAVSEDDNGNIWVGDRDSKGISIFNKKTCTFTYCTNDPMNRFSLGSNKITKIYTDRDGSVWVGTITGVNKYSPNKIKFNRFFSIPVYNNWLSENNVLCFAEGRDGYIWVGTDGGGLNKFNRKTREFTRFRFNPKNNQGISSDVVTSLCEDHEGVLWFGTFNGGLGRYKDNKFETFYNDPSDPWSISQNHIWCVFEDSKNNIWAGTLFKGLNLYDRKTNRFYTYRGDDDEPTSISNNSIINIYETKDQKLYISTNNGTNVVDLNTVDFSKPHPEIIFKRLYHSEEINSISSNNVYGMCEDDKGNMWFGHTSTGLDKLDKKTGLFTNYSDMDGIPGNSVTSIQIDKEQNLWLATDKGLARFNTLNGKVEVFDGRDGLQNSNFKGWSIKTRDGEMYFGGPDGFNSFYPEIIEKRRNHHKPHLMITGFKILNKRVKIDNVINGRVILNEDISLAKKIVLTRKENQFSFEFVALDYTSPEKNKYAYKLEGFDEDWNIAGSKREASYTNLDPGDYVFRVKASNNDGVWNEEGATIMLTVLPAWWETWIFRIVSVLLVLVIILFTFQNRIGRVKKQKVLLEKLVAEKTSELKQQNEKLKDVVATKDKFFSIVAHDIKNPFNAILGFSDLLKDNYEEWDDETRKEFITQISVSSKNLYQLLDNLLAWSKSQRGLMNFNPGNIELMEIIMHVEELMQATALAKNIQLIKTIPDNNIMVFADAQMVGTILRNLISNSLKFTPEGGTVKLNVSVEAEMARIEVIDNGVGMSDEIKNMLFRIDTHFTSLGTNKEKGTGLGLILVKEFVTKQGGELGIESEPGKGTKFYFTLPLAKS